MATWYNAFLGLLCVYAEPGYTRYNSGWTTDGVSLNPDFSIPAGTRLLRAQATVNAVTTEGHGTASAPGAYIPLPAFAGAAYWRLTIPTALPDERSGSALREVPVLTGAISPYYSIQDLVDTDDSLIMAQWWREPSGTVTGQGQRRTSGWDASDTVEQAQLDVDWGVNSDDWFNGTIVAHVRLLWDFDIIYV